jgi:hypothetical protein
MRHTAKWVVVSHLVLLVLLSACSSPAPSADTSKVSGLAGTLAVQTIMASDGLLAKIYTPTPPPPTATPPPPLPKAGELNLQVSNTPVPSLTPIQSGLALSDKITPLAVGTDTPCNAAEFIKDVTIPDDSVIGPREKFTKIWQLRNVGSCAWDTSYALVRVWGEAFGAPELIPLSQNVLPGELIDVTVEMVSPDWPACFQGNWMFQDPQGNRFGTGYKFKEFFWISVTVWSPDFGIPLKVGG